MQSPSKAAPRGFFLTGRSKWLWLGLFGLLGVWLITLLIVGERQPAAVPLPQAVGANIPPFQAKTVDAFSGRRELRATRPSAVPFRVDDGSDHGQGK